MKFFKVFSVFAFLISAVSLAGVWFLYDQLGKERLRNEELEAQLIQLEGESLQWQEIGEKFDQLQQEAGRLRTQMKGYVEQRDKVKKELDQAYRETAELRKQIMGLESEKGALSELVTEEETKEKAIVQEATRLPVAMAVPPPFIPSVLPQPKTEKTKEAKALPQTPSLPKEEKAPSLAPATIEDQRPSQVLSVNRKFNFVVVNVGIRDQAKIGDRLRVEQGGKLIGRVAVEKLYENFSACTIVEEIKPHQIKEGDLVRLA
jgi:myosin heavy subunit